MKLPNRKVIRLRQTIYEDPGNPFADEVETNQPEESAVKSNQEALPLRPPSIERTLSAEPISLKWSWPAPVTYRHPSFGERTVPARIQMHRRSKSVAGPTKSPIDSPEHYVAPRSLWRRDTLPTSHGSEDAGDAKSDVRDTKFYGFYDDVLQDYGSRRK